MLGKLKDWLKPKTTPVTKMEESDVGIVKDLHKTGVPVGEIALAMDKSETRIRYELKQLEKGK